MSPKLSGTAEYWLHKHPVVDQEEFHRNLQTLQDHYPDDLVMVTYRPMHIFALVVWSPTTKVGHLAKDSWNLRIRSGVISVDPRQIPYRKPDHLCGSNSERLVTDPKMTYIQKEGGTKPGSAHLNPPSKCDLCSEEIANEFYDCNVSLQGRWGNLCPACFVKTGSKIGPGRGQKYSKV